MIRDTDQMDQQRFYLCHCGALFAAPSSMHKCPTCKSTGDREFVAKVFFNPHAVDVVVTKQKS